MLKFKVIKKYTIWLFIALALGLGVVAVEVEFFLKRQDFITGFFVETFGSLKRMIITYLGGLIGVFSFLIFMLIDVYKKKNQSYNVKNQNLVRFIVILLLVVVLKIMHSLIAYKFHLI